jgi:hypothetical protein
MTGTSASYLDVGFPIKGWPRSRTCCSLRRRRAPPASAAPRRRRAPTCRSTTRSSTTVCERRAQHRRQRLVACFANDIGVFLTNGTAFPEDLTKSCGISKYWRDPHRAHVELDARRRLVRQHLRHQRDERVDAHRHDRLRHQKRSAYRFSNLKALAFWAAGASGQELYAGSRAAPRVLQLSTMWTPSATFKNDGDGTAVTGTWESPFYDTQKIGSQRWRPLPRARPARRGERRPDVDALVLQEPGGRARRTRRCPPRSARRRKTTVKVPIHDKSIGMGFKITRRTPPRSRGSTASARPRTSARARGATASKGTPSTQQPRRRSHAREPGDVTQEDIALMQRVLLRRRSQNPNLIPDQFMAYLLDYVQTSNLIDPIGQVFGYQKDRSAGHHRLRVRYPAPVDGQIVLLKVGSARHSRTCR